MEISRDGHRARMRAAYLQGGGDAMPDHQLLELLLSISIPRKDVKPIAYALINRFGCWSRCLPPAQQICNKCRASANRPPYRFCWYGT